MNKNEEFVITINRELGSGGRTVGRKLSELLGVPFYDKCLIHELKKIYSLNTEEMESVKSGKNSVWCESYVSKYTSLPVMTHTTTTLSSLSMVRRRIK